MKKSLIIKVIADNIHKGSKSIISKFTRNNKGSKELLALLVVETENLNMYSPSVSQRLYHIYNNKEDVVFCEVCGKPAIYKTFEKGYIDFCSMKCVQKSQTTKEKIKQSNISRYGVEHFSKTEEGKNISKKNGKTYGFGTEYNKQKINEKYGCTTNISQTDHWLNKVKKTMNDKYGVDNVAQLARSEGSGYKTKTHMLPSGKVLKLQGYEWCAIESLLNMGIREDDIITGRKEIENEIGQTWYYLDDKRHKYFPDIYVKSINKIIEVKSKYTYKFKQETNAFKKQAILNKNINFEFWVFVVKRNKTYLLEII